MARILLLTGTPGVGKTTVIQKLAAALAGCRLGGFCTEEIRVAGQRRGFRAVTFDGRTEVIADVGFSGPHRVGKYGVDLDVLDAIVDSTLRVSETVDVYLVDEIGNMECLSPRFVAAMCSLLESPARVVATIGLRGGGFIAQVKRRPDVESWQVTRGNRDGLPARALAWVRDRESATRH